MGDDILHSPSAISLILWRRRDIRFLPVRIESGDEPFPTYRDEDNIVSSGPFGFQFFGICSNCYSQSEWPFLLIQCTRHDSLVRQRRRIYSDLMRDLKYLVRSRLGEQDVWLQYVHYLHERRR